jgi:hypothetical protein
MHNVIRKGAEYEDRETSSYSAFLMTVAWLNECLASHEKCSKAAILLSPPLPTRIIDVGSSNGSSEPRLHLGGIQCASYFTLSYRWSYKIASTFQLTKSNLEEYKIAIQLATLPQTIQDAILLTRRFSIRFLWVDALCILQDSDNDWSREAKSMASIYANSLLTIAAASESMDDMTSGLFHTRS